MADSGLRPALTAPPGPVAVPVEGLIDPSTCSGVLCPFFGVQDYPSFFCGLMIGIADPENAVEHALSLFLN